jgi:hypothetical protein
MSMQTGDDGKVMIGGAELAEITAWTFETSARRVAYASSATGGYRKQLTGVKEGRGTIDFKLNLTNPLTNHFNEGSQVTLLLYIDNTRFYSVPSVIDSLEMAVNIDGGELIGGRAKFTTNGAWTGPSY